MNNEMIELARRAVASPHWRWMPGMRLVCPGSDEAFRVESEPAWNGGLYRAFGISEDWIAAPEDELPDLDDPATLGCLHDLACAALGADVIDIRADIAPDMSGQPRAWWTARELRGRRVASGRVESLTLRAAGYVAALEAAAEVEQ